ncbi:MAG: hypothetical protein LBS64_03235 [Spirochaetaceae bacterium]|jgi:hypothetical protein|nr:hypothetical protein [Spirochaetaceae bacterium]
MRIIRSAVPFLRFAAFLWIFAACNNRAAPPRPIQAAGEAAAAIAPPVIYSSHVAVLFDRGQDTAFVESALEGIREKYGLFESQGLVYPILFPGDFQPPRISLLPGKLAEIPLRALVILDAPEGTHRALARLQDTWRETGTVCPVIAINPQGELLGIQSGSDLVLDIDIDELQPSDGGRFHAQRVLMQILEYFGVNEYTEWQAAHDPKADAEDLLYQCGDGWTTRPFVDKDTGLRAANHFVVTGFQPKKR